MNRQCQDAELKINWLCLLAHPRFRTLVANSGRLTCLNECQAIVAKRPGIVQWAEWGLSND